MKLKLTEAQFEKVRLLKESTDVVTQFEEYCSKKNEELNFLYSKIIHISVEEVLSLKVNLDGLEKHLNQMEDEVMTADRKAYDVINNMPEADLDIRIDNAYRKVSDKISSLNLILLSLEKIQDYEKEHNLSKSFGEVKPIDITRKQ